MVEGFDHDDRYRMVEDEFMTIAKTFTVHLHAAEYKRQQKMVRSRNADTINSISRPVTGKMPDHTRRRVEGVARSKEQRAAIERLVGKKKKHGGISDDSDDDVGLPYIGTTLHGLMDSPRKKAASLAKAGSIVATTRAAAGFSRPTAHFKPHKNSVPDSPLSKRVTRFVDTKDDDETETSSDNDDDLDAPLLAPKLLPLERKSMARARFSSTSPPVRPAKQPSYINDVPQSTSPFETPVKAETLVKAECTSHSFDELPDFLISRSSRLERSRQRKALKQDPDLPLKKLDEIPSFF
jgi:hypothetical protein